MVEMGAGPGPFFRFQDGKLLTKMRFVTKIKEALTAVGIDCIAYSGHSFRSGAATTAEKQGILDAAIKMLGRWKSSAYQLYVQILREQLAAYSSHSLGITTGHNYHTIWEELLGFVCSFLSSCFHTCNY